ncbi:MAG: nitrous oxide-stimulated promoter family protein [Muribaculaceae bacterium]|nr:nitrous oxide-stimulated promoter family protein [Muribaculaceae bacterium]
MGKRIEREKRTVETMIRMYCRGHCHASDGDLCGECSELLAYAIARLSRCPHGDGKPTCRRCMIHCYRKDMRERIGTVMRWSGKRMIIRHPIAAVRHLLGR